MCSHFVLAFQHTQVKKKLTINLLLYFMKLCAECVLYVSLLLHDQCMSIILETVARHMQNNDHEMITPILMLYNFAI